MFFFLTTFFKTTQNNIIFLGFPKGKTGIISVAKTLLKRHKKKILFTPTNLPYQDFCIE